MISDLRSEADNRLNYLRYMKKLSDIDYHSTLPMANSYNPARAQAAGYDIRAVRTGSGSDRMALPSKSKKSIGAALLPFAFFLFTAYPVATAPGSDWSHAEDEERKISVISNPVSSLGQYVYYVSKFSSKRW